LDSAMMKAGSWRSERSEWMVDKERRYPSSLSCGCWC